MDFVEALAIATGVFDQYKADQLKWWKRMDGTPILNDVAVRMAEAFRDAAAPAAPIADTDENAPWLTLAHMICADAGIPCGHITDRLTALRGKMEAAPIAEVTAAGWIVESSHDTDFTNDPDLAAYWTRKRRNVEPLYRHPAAEHAKPEPVEQAVELMNCVTRAWSAWESSPIKSNDGLLFERMLDLHEAGKAYLAGQQAGAVDGEKPDFGTLYSTRRNAARYRWLLKELSGSLALDIGCAVSEISDEIDAAIAASATHKEGK